MKTYPPDTDTLVRCPKCGRKQYLLFKNGLKNGWSKCCGYTMPIVKTKANIEQVVVDAACEGMKFGLGFEEV